MKNHLYQLFKKNIKAYFGKKEEDNSFIFSVNAPKFKFDLKSEIIDIDLNNSIKIPYKIEYDTETNQKFEISYIVEEGSGKLNNLENSQFFNLDKDLEWLSFNPSSIGRIIVIITLKNNYDFSVEKKLLFNVKIPDFDFNIKTINNESNVNYSIELLYNIKNHNEYVNYQYELIYFIEAGSAEVEGMQPNVFKSIDKISGIIKLIPKSQGKLKIKFFVKNQFNLIKEQNQSRLLSENYLETKFNYAPITPENEKNVITESEKEISENEGEKNEAHNIKILDNKESNIKKIVRTYNLNDLGESKKEQNNSDTVKNSDIPSDKEDQNQVNSNNNLTKDRGEDSEDDIVKELENDYNDFHEVEDIYYPIVDDNDNPNLDDFESPVEVEFTDNAEIISKTDDLNNSTGAEITSMIFKTKITNNTFFESFKKISKENTEENSSESSNVQTSITFDDSTELSSNEKLLNNYEKNNDIKTESEKNSYETDDNVLNFNIFEKI